MREYKTEEIKAQNDKKTYLVYIIAGEISGDQIGKQVIVALKEKLLDKIQFEGIGGEAMASQGFKSLFPMTELSIMGILEILPQLPNIYARLNQTFEDIKKLKPDLLLTIDSPGFNFHIAKKVKKLGIPVVHYIAPSVWAWRPGRAKKVAGFLDHLLALLPFEPPYFTKEGLACTFVGHPLIEKHLSEINPKHFLKSHKITEQMPLLCVLPGSRQTEVSRHLPLFLDAIELLRQDFRDLVTVFPTLPHLRDKIEQTLSQRGIRGIIITDETKKFEAMRAATAALAASGTVTLELGLCETPMVVAYRVNPLTAWIVEKLLVIEQVSLVNILLKEKVVPEILQEQCTPEVLSQELHKILDKRAESRRLQVDKLKQIAPLISPEKGTPSANAANVILSLLQK